MRKFISVMTATVMLSTMLGLPLPYSMDGIILNLPAMLAGLPQDAYLTEFIPTPSAAELEDEEVVTDETEGLMDFGE